MDIDCDYPSTHCDYPRDYQDISNDDLGYSFDTAGELNSDSVGDAGCVYV